MTTGAFGSLLCGRAAVGAGVVGAGVTVTTGGGGTGSMIGRVTTPSGAGWITRGVVAAAGAIGFVGLVVPHLLRGAVGGVPSRLLPASALGGAALVLAADVAVRLILPERDLKLGVMMALVGAPVFLHLIWRTQAGR